jgi:hypothetical protein
MTRPEDDPKQIPQIEPHIAGGPHRARGISTATAATTPLLHYRQAPAWQAYRVLRAAFFVLPAVEGADKLLKFMFRWDRFVFPLLPAKLGIDMGRLLQIAGGIELGLALIVAWRPRLGSYLLLVWLGLESVDLCLMPGLYDVALYRLILMLCVLAMTRLAEEFRQGITAVQDWQR